MCLTAAVLVAACGGSDTAPTDDPMSIGREVYGRICSTCHGPGGAGGVGPALTGVLETFPACGDQERWIRLGSHRWKDEVSPTYGAAGREVKGAMPSFESSLTTEEIAAVASFERVRYGGGDVASVTADCASG